ncbi:cysteine desulfurase family protein [Alkalihalobacillus sp. FSL R5-0424]
MSSSIYLDNNATTPLDPSVYEKMKASLKEQYGNPSSKYSLGIEAKTSLDHARHSIASYLNSSPEQIYFTSGASESNSAAIMGYCLKNKEKNHIITSSIEHPAVLETFKFLKEYHSFTVSYLPVNSDGVILIDLLPSFITSNTSLIAVMMVNNEIGTIQPIKQIGEICKERSIHFHCDAVQAAGKLQIDVNELHINTLSLSAHKVYGPKGVGCLFIKDKNKLHPLVHGGSQEMGFRSGTENVAGIVGFGQAITCIMNEWQHDLDHLKVLRQTFIQELSHISDWSINGRCTVPSTLSLTIRGIRGEALAQTLSYMGVYVSIASACSASSSKLSHVLKAMNKSDEDIRSTIRISFGKQNTLEEIIKATQLLTIATNKLRTLAPKATV